ncbi:MAG: hypothetical protein HUJ77_10280 [Clostridium sp.]|uniref:hypothetical protein n=1 Tax=Clostridium sp. TaxID=1506 RepID=UPI0025C23449|nr:hypothetical protein [Clostridium sp.]MCF0148767.1 hypothetical protein [Clostridium sp.]
MNYDRGDYGSLQELYDDCNKLKEYHITIVMKDGSTVDGIIEKVDSNGIIMLVGEDIMDEEDTNESNEQRQFGRRPGMARYRRFRRRGYPFNSIRRVFPIGYPYPFPYYPFFPY